jgi:hypothetical protein
LSIGRNHDPNEKDIRDVNAAYLQAHIEEYNAYKRAGNESRAAAVAEVLRQMGHEVEMGKKPAPTRENAVSPEPLERAVEETAPKRRGRPSARNPE